MAVNVETLLSASCVPALNAAGYTDLIFWTKTSLFEWADEAVRRMARAAAGLISTATTSIAADDADYATPTRCLSILHVSAKGKTLRPANVRDLEARSSNWRADTSSTALSHYARQDQGLAVIRVYPTPAAPLSGDINITAHVAPAAVTEGSPSLSWPDALSGYVALRTLEAARKAETYAKMPEAAAVAGEIAGVFEQAATALWGEVQ